MTVLETGWLVKPAASVAVTVTVLVPLPRTSAAVNSPLLTGTVCDEFLAVTVTVVAVMSVTDPETVRIGVPVVLPVTGNDDTATRGATVFSVT